MFTITEVYNNIPCREGLTPDWGFSCLVEEAGLLFDTGAKGDVLLSNMRALGIDPADIRYLVLSHDHWDHGGCAILVNLDGGLRSRRLTAQTLGMIGEYTKPRRQGWMEIADGIAVTGPLGTDMRERSLLSPPLAATSIPGVRTPTSAGSSAGSLRRAGYGGSSADSIPSPPGISARSPVWSISRHRTAPMRSPRSGRGIRGPSGPAGWGRCTGCERGVHGTLQRIYPFTEYEGT